MNSVSSGEDNHDELHWPASLMASPKFKKKNDKAPQQNKYGDIQGSIHSRAKFWSN